MVQNREYSNSVVAQSRSGGSRNVILSVTVLLVLVAQFSVVQSISTEEKAALAEILVGHPDLSSVPSWLQLTDDGNSYGRSWPSDTSGVCSIDGYDIYGVYCGGGSIVGLRITAAFGLPTLTSFPAVSGLISLRNLTVSVEVDNQFYAPLVTSIAKQNLPLIHIELPGPFAPLPSSLVYLSFGWTSSLPLSDLPNLRYLRYAGNQVGGLNTPHPSLEELHLYTSASYQTVFPWLSNFPALSVFECDCSGSNTVAAEFNSDRIKSLTLSQLYNGIPPIVSGKNLEVLEAYRAEVTLGDLPSLKYLSCASYSNQAQNLPNQLQTLLFRGTDWKAVSLEDVVCPLIRSSVSSLESLTIYPSIFRPEAALPTCITLANLKYLHLAHLNASFLGPLPLSLTGLSLLSLQPPTAFRDLYHLPNIRSLELVVDRGQDEIPSDFFDNFPNLRTLKISGSSLGGTLPQIVGPMLEVVEIDTACNVWEGLRSTPNLKTLRISSNYLRYIPAPDKFVTTNLPSLQVFELHSDYALGPVPTFWTRSTSLSRVSIRASCFGPLPTDLSVPRLQYLELLSPHVCGRLPNFLVPTHLTNLILHTNSISGTIPASWEDNLTILENIELQNTFISGTIPQRLFNHHTFKLRQVQFSNTFVSGNIWDSVRGMPERLYFSNTLLRLSCPPYPAQGNSRAIFTNISSCPQDSECVQAWEAATSSFVCSNQNDRVLPIVGICSLELRCPIPAPPAPFECGSDGGWLLKRSVFWEVVSFGPNLGVVSFEIYSGAQNITFNGPGTTLSIPKCMRSLSRVIIEIDSNSNFPVPAGDITLIQQGEACTQVDLSKVPIEVVPLKSCVIISTASSTASKLSLSYTIQNECVDNSSAGISASPKKSAEWILVFSLGLFLLSL